MSNDVEINQNRPNTDDTNVPKWMKNVWRDTNFNKTLDGSQQLRRNIKACMGNANITSLQTWLQVIRSVKETTMHGKNQERIHDFRAQSITRFLVRQPAR